MAEQKTVTLVISGMTCRHCVMAVKKGLAFVPGVSDVVVTLEPPRAVVTCDLAITGREALEAAVRDAGYVASGPSSGPAADRSRRDGEKSGDGLE